MTNETGVDWLENSAIQLIKTIDAIREMDSVRQKYGVLISDQKFMARFGKKWRAYALALELYRILLQDMQRFIFEKRGFVEKIRPLDIELAKRIDLLEISPKEELEVLEPLARVLNEAPTLAISYINTKYTEIIEKLKTFNDKETAYELRRVVIIISGREVAELQKCVADAERWPSYRLRNRIDFFTLRLTLYLKGGEDNSTRETYLGLASHFKDATLVKQMMDAPQIRKIWTYKQEEQFFRWGESLIKRSLQEGGWQGFYAFYDNIKRGENYARMVRERFGNPEFADFLERLPKAVHENPTVWEADLKNLSDKLEDQSYQNVHVIEPAKQALIAIFNTRIEQLIAARRSALKDLKKVIDAKIEELKNTKLTTQKNFVRIIKKKKQKLLTEWEKMKSEFEIKEKKLVLRGSIYLGRCDKLLEELHLGRKFGIYYRLLDISMKWINFMKPYIERSRRNIFGSLRLRAAATRLDQIEDKEFKLIYSMANPDEIAMLRLERLILKGNKKIVPRFADLINNIKTKLENDFTMDINTLRRLKLETEQKRIGATEETKKAA